MEDSGDTLSAKVNILCLLGRAGHGKSTVANYLRSAYGCEVVSLATSLKRVAQKVMGFSDAQLYGPQEIKEAVDPRYGMSPRRFLQLLGTEGLRQEFGYDVHINNLLRQLETQQRQWNTVYVVDDTRFPDEVSALGDPRGRAHGAVIKIVCTDLPISENEHASEALIDTIPDDAIAATVVSSRAQGTSHLIAQVEHAFRTSLRLARFNHLLRPQPYRETEYQERAP